ncbi:nitronate monooxygenase [Spongiibacter nanhainus]|uniref:Nitronate monooxygenase n=1 Tax=Spongiibacter nanhainus TaxID=2794344 RepID=A0A7T4R478_9GAMM|nr:nitronate monooxygenase [Spongiibacter nanhainus]QQD20185.1 nitronate monooxygenase [Spongiibacter nanhainus]
MLGIELPVFAFSHCRDVVVEVSKAGGMGVLGASGFPPERLEEELAWIDAHVDGKPYGVDLLIPNTYEKRAVGKLDIASLIPKEFSEFLARKCDEANIPPLPEAEAKALLKEQLDKVQMTPEEATGLLDVALRHPIKLLVNALGTPPRETVKMIQDRGIRVASLIGKVDHARAQVEAGVDFVVAQGSEAGGHTGNISSMVLWPQVIDAVAPMPVLAAGGIARGSQMAAAITMGAAGVWTGSIWLGTAQSELEPKLKQRLFAAKSEDAIQSRAMTGKPCRMLRSEFSEMWQQPGAPATLPMPLQTIATAEMRMRIQRAGVEPYMSYPVGQVVGDMNSETSVRQVVMTMLEEFLDAAGWLTMLVEESI